MRRELIDKASKTLSTLNLIWFAMFFSLMIFAFLGVFLKGYIALSFGEADLKIVRTIFYLLTIGTVTYSVYARRSYLKKGKEGRSIDRSLELYRIAVIVSIGISEFIGVFGFLLLLLGDRFYGFPLILTAGLTMLYHRPKRSEILWLNK